MSLLIRVKEDMAALIEKRSRYRFWDKERERSNHAKQIADSGPRRPHCAHNRIAWSGPPHDIVQAITCLDCQGFVTEPEMKDRGFDFATCPDWIYEAIINEKLDKVFLKGNPTQFVMNRR